MKKQVAMFGPMYKVFIMGKILRLMAGKLMLLVKMDISLNITVMAAHPGLTGFIRFPEKL